MPILTVSQFPLESHPIPWIDELSQDFGQLDNWLNSFGSPLNLLNSRPFLSNIDALDAVLRNHVENFQIHYAMKANRCPEFAMLAARKNIGIDVASLHELDVAIQAGFAGDSITVTGIVKSQSFLQKAIRTKALIVIDNADEIEDIEKAASITGLKAEVALRISGFEIDEVILQSRFGVDPDSVDSLANRVGESNEALQLAGLHFHLSGYAPRPRQAALEECIRIAQRLNEGGASIRSVDIGGGFPVSYLKSETQWNEFLSHAAETEIPRSSEEENYPYFNRYEAASYFQTILGGVAEKLGELGIRLRCEPGRSLLAGVGATIARIVSVRRAADGSFSINCDMNGSQLRPSRGDFLVDPVVVHPERARGGSINSVACRLFGRYCSENDALFQRPLEFPFLPQKGDIILIPNTAGYHMHFMETRGHGFALARNYFVDPAGQEASQMFESID